MNRDSDSRRSYDRTRDAFEDLSLEEQALFLVEATASAAARGAARAGRALSDELGDLFRSASRASRGSRRSRRDEPHHYQPHHYQSHRDDSGHDRPGPAEPPTGQQRAPGPADGDD